MLKTFNSSRVGVAIISIALLGLNVDVAAAQQATEPAAAPPAAGALPPVVISAPTRRAVRPAAKQSTRSAESRPRPARRVLRRAPVPRAPAPAPVPGPETAQRTEDPRGPINGYVANRASTATKTNTPIMETPQAISVIGRDEIRDQNPRKFDEALRYGPGVRAEIFGADTRNDWFQVRGFQTNDVGYFLDGLQIFSTAFATWKLQPFGLERIDILRGPSAVLYGGSGPGGIINAISKKPPAAPLNYLEAGVNSFGNRYFSFDFGGPVPVPANDGKLFYRLLGTAKAGDTQVDFTRDNSYFVAPSVTYKPDIDTTLTVLASASKDKTNGQNFLPYVGTVVPAPFGRISTSLFTSDPSVDTFKREQAMIGYQFERNLTDSLTFRQNARFAHVEVLYSTLLGLGYATTPAAANLARGNFLARDSANQSSLDNQLEYRFNTGAIQHTALFGVDLKRYDIDDFQGFGAASSLNLVNPVYAPTAMFTGTPFANHQQTQSQVGVYAQDQIKLDRWTLMLSGRNDWVNTEDNNRIGASLNRDDSKFSGRAGLIYNTGFGIAPYVSYATSYNPIIGTNFTNNQLFLPETGEQTEVGIKIEPAGLNGHVGAAVFDLKRQNVLTANPLNALISIQNGEVTSRGVELEAAANPLPGLKFVSTFTAFNIFVSKDLNPAIVGTVPTNTPDRVGSVWADYTLQSGPLAGLGFGGGVRYVGASFADTANTLAVPSHLVGDAAVHYEFRNWRVAVNVTNITDETFVGSCQTTSACFYGDRRRAVASVAYKW